MLCGGQTILSQILGGTGGLWTGPGRGNFFTRDAHLWKDFPCQTHLKANFWAGWSKSTSMLKQQLVEKKQVRSNGQHRRREENMPTLIQFRPGISQTNAHKWAKSDEPGKTGWIGEKEIFKRTNSDTARMKFHPNIFLVLNWLLMLFAASLCGKHPLFLWKCFQKIFGFRWICFMMRLNNAVLGSNQCSHSKRNQLERNSGRMNAPRLGKYLLRTFSKESN